ncbi:hypothetical protein R9C00_16905 [Flammeovirgaceae bacterium SG7u.111]|nr:hypothetical protein [Flammeovirgaceae bacterium SG7u.132]WPO33380.1 hypothetical protein R9C00_16905 [Flammeovirgaceae bacterium SG7u.111]
MDVLIGKINVFQTNTIELIDKEITEDKTIFSFPRVGLSLKRINYFINGDNKAEAAGFNYIFKNWRFITKPSKTQNGKHLMALKLIKDGESEDEVCSLLDLGLSTLKSYKKHIETAFDPQEIIELSKQKQSVEIMCQLYEYLYQKD